MRLMIGYAVVGILATRSVYAERNYRNIKSKSCVDRAPLGLADIRSFCTSLLCTGIVVFFFSITQYYRDKLRFIYAYVFTLHTARIKKLYTYFSIFFGKMNLFSVLNQACKYTLLALIPTWFSLYIYILTFINIIYLNGWSYAKLISHWSNGVYVHTSLNVIKLLPRSLREVSPITSLFCLVDRNELLITRLRST